MKLANFTIKHIYVHLRFVSVSEQFMNTFVSLMNETDIKSHLESVHERIN